MFIGIWISFPDVNKTLQRFVHSTVVHMVIQDLTHFAVFVMMANGLIYVFGHMEKGLYL